MAKVHALSIVTKMLGEFLPSRLALYNEFTSRMVRSTLR